MYELNGFQVRLFGIWRIMRRVLLVYLPMELEGRVIGGKVHVKLQSPKFETQLQIRENAEYYEPCSTIAMAIEAEVPAVIGEPMLGQNVIDGFKNLYYQTRGNRKDDGKLICYITPEYHRFRNKILSV